MALAPTSIVRGAVNPVIVIPTFWGRGDASGPIDVRGAFDRATPLDEPEPPLAACLDSLDQVSGVLRVVVLVAAPEADEGAARARVDSICAAHPGLNPLVIGSQEASHIEHAVGRMAHHVTGEIVSLSGCGAIRNMGLAVAAVLGHDVVVFLDDNEVVLGEDFLAKAVWGLGSLTRQSLPVLAKSGFFLDADGDPYARPNSEWSERYWSKAANFNRVMERAQTGSSRITRSNHLCGGCCALHAAAWSKVPFDPYITRGEDLDYLLDLRAHGVDVWFDSAWFVRARGGDDEESPARFMRDVYRWLYERRKLDVMNARRDLRTITPESLMPYPAPWLSSEARERVFHTALRRFVTGPDRLAYLKILTKGRYDAEKFARLTSSRYLSFAMVWPTIVSALWCDQMIAAAILHTGELGPDLSATAPSDPLGDTGALPMVGEDQ